jgi:hypothetical protein
MHNLTEPLGRRQSMGSRITTVSTREIAFPREATLKAIWEIKNIELTEVKADAVHVDPETPTKGTYRVRGRFAGVPWHGEFAYELNEGGFHSRTAGVPPDQATVEGGFVVTPIAGGCTVIHYEQYVLAPWLRPIKPVVWMYLRWSMRRELRDLEALVRRSQSSDRERVRG